MNARAVAVWCLAALVVDLVSNDPVYRGLVVLVALDVLAARAPVGRRLRPTAVAALVLGAFAVGWNVLLSHTGSDVLVRLPDGWPLVGGPLTLESVAYGATAGLGLAGAVLAVAPLSLVLEPHDLLDALPRPLERSGLALAAALNLVPGIARTAATVRDAERLRGWRPRGPRSWGDLLVPTLLGALEDALALAEAMEARGYGTLARTRYQPPRMRRADLLTAGAACLAAASFLAARVRGWPLDWTPYPALGPPTVEPLLLVACLCLALPAVPWPPSRSTD